MALGLVGLRVFAIVQVVPDSECSFWSTVWRLRSLLFAVLHDWDAAAAVVACTKYPIDDETAIFRRHGIIHFRTYVAK